MGFKVPEVYTEFKAHVDSLDFGLPVFDALVPQPLTGEDYDNCKKAADEVGRQLLRIKENGRLVKPKYWGAPVFKGLNPLQIEAKIIRDQSRAGYGLDSKVGLPIYVHALRLMKLLFPDTDITPVLADICKLFFANFSHGRKYLHLLGSQDSGKSSTIARLIFVCMVIDSKHTFAPVASPFVNTAETIIWGDILELANEILDAHKDENGVNTVFPDMRIVGARINFTKDGKGKAGWAAIRNLKKQGKLIGAKNIGSDPRVGIGLIAFDEINRAEQTGFTDELSNVGGQDWFQMLSAQNPKDEDDVGGQFATPKVWEGWGYSSYDEIRKHLPIIWPTVKSGIAYRLNGLDSANMRLGKVIYPYQFNEKKRKLLEDDYGVQSPQYFSQALALFPSSAQDARLLSQSRVASSKHEDEFFSMKEIKGRVLFCDPAHTGHGDKACMGTAYFGTGIVTNSDATQSEVPLFVIPSAFEHIKFINGLEWDVHAGEEYEMMQEFRDIGVDFNDVTHGAPVTYEQQIALAIAQRARDEGIPHRNIGYDFSMRHEMVAAANLVIGASPEPFDYNTKAIGYQLHATKQNTEDKCPQSNGRTFELGHLTVDLFNAKQLRGGQFIRAAILQTCKTRLLVDKPHTPFEKKSDYKARNENKSPDDRDCLFGLVGMAFLRGFRSVSNATNLTVDAESIFRNYRKTRGSMKKSAKPLP